MFLDLSPGWDPALGACPYLGTSPCNCWEPLNSRMSGHLEVSHRGFSPCHSEARRGFAFLPAAAVLGQLCVPSSSLTEVLGAAGSGTWPLIGKLYQLAMSKG